MRTFLISRFLGERPDSHSDSVLTFEQPLGHPLQVFNFDLVEILRVTRKIIITEPIEFHEAHSHSLTISPLHVSLMGSDQVIARAI